MSKFAGIQVGLMQLRHIDFRLTVTAQIVELNPFHVCTTHSQCLVIFSTELLFCKKEIFFQLIAMVPLSMCFSLVQDKEHARSLPIRHIDWFDLHKKTARYSMRTC